MKITQLKQQVKNPERVSVFVDGAYTFSLTVDQVLAERLKKDTELSEQDIERFKKLSGEGKMRARALEWLMSRPHSERELRDYLMRKKAEKEFVEAVVAEFRERGYLNDERFAEWFVELRLRKGKSLRAVEAELRTKGLSPVTIQNIVKVHKASGEGDILKIKVNKLRTKSRYQDSAKLKAYLLRQGFSYDDVKEAVDEQGI